MPAGPDVRYHLVDPAARPQHDRFAKGSYLYIYHNPTTQQAKLEVANHAGTSEQDAFAGYLGAASVEYSYNHPTLLTIAVDTQAQDPGQWRLPAYDLRHEQKYMYQLHSLDFYLWTEKDATTLLGHLKAVIPGHKLAIRDAPSGVSPRSSLPAEHRDSMSPVVQQLEKTAIGTYFPRAGSTVSAQSIPGPPTPGTNATASPQLTAPQPIAAAMGGYNPAAPSAPEPVMYREKTPPPLDDGTGMGLNNAARYDNISQPQYASVPPGYQQNSNQPTPQGAYFIGAPQQQQQQQQPPTPGFPGPPQATPPNIQRTFSGGLPPPPPPSGGPSPQPQSQQQQQQHYPSSFSHQPTSPTPNQQNFHHHHPQPSFGGGGPPGQTQYATFAQQAQYTGQQQDPGTPSFGPYAAASPGIPPQAAGYQSMQPQPQPPTPSAPPAYAGHTPLQSPGLPGPPPPQIAGQQQQQQQQQVFGYSSYTYTPSSNSYAASQHLTQQGAYTGDIHSQVYRPNEGEANTHDHHGGGGHGSRPQGAGRQGSGSTGGGGGQVRLEERVSGIDKRVGGFLKRLDKLI
ncbi:hypothetical protein LTR78_004786 [Recurvomyces mirabilis]|uniref:RNA recognition motif-containing protein n=1 Tax=Recurvomyces mirabilis TaxID=574656 RepID=A0AAE1C265_9PEZI|nr:hypothetical protein LTR78_004786 [Recurvomyces mirabilis]